jgi:hypothetical protein
MPGVNKSSLRMPDYAKFRKVNRIDGYCKRGIRTFQMVHDFDKKAKDLPLGGTERHYVN